MKISQVKKQQIYDAVHESIMQARLKIWKMKDNKNISIAEIDEILSELCIKAPDKAICCFTTNEKSG